MLTEEDYDAAEVAIENYLEMERVQKLKDVEAGETYVFGWETTNGIISFRCENCKKMHTYPASIIKWEESWEILPIPPEYTFDCLTLLAKLPADKDSDKWEEMYDELEVEGSSNITMIMDQKPLDLTGKWWMYENVNGEGSTPTIESTGFVRYPFSGR